MMSTTPEASTIPDYTQELHFFNDNGFLVIPNFFPREQLDALQNEVSALIEQYEFKVGDKNTFATALATQNDDKYFLESSNKISFFLEDEALAPDGTLCVPKHHAFNKIAHALHDLNPVFEQFSYQPKLYHLMKALGFTTPQIAQSMWLFKSAKIGAPIYPHQDTTFLQTQPASCVGFWLGLDDATEENGCMYFVPGSHKAPVERFFNLNAEKTACAFNIDGYKYDTTKAIPVPVTAGSLVLIHGAVVHYSGPNKSEKRRNAYSLHVIDGKYDYPATNWLQRSPKLPFRNVEDVTTGLYPAECSERVD